MDNVGSVLETGFFLFAGSAPIGEKMSRRTIVIKVIGRYPTGFPDVILTISKYYFYNQSYYRNKDHA